MVKKKNKITAVIQARLNSIRFKNKILKKIKGKEVIKILIERLKLSKEINDIIVAIPNTRSNDSLELFLKKNNINVFRGSEKNVLKRFLECSRKNNINNIVRITSDCPLIDPKILDKMGIAIRTGHHCTQPIMKRFNIPGTARISLAVYNTKEEIDICMNAIKKAKQMLS